MILKIGEHKYIDVDSYGCFTWGSLSQTSLKRNKDTNMTEGWFISTNYCVDPTDDIWETDIEPLDVLEVLYELPTGENLVNEEEYEAFQRMIAEYFPMGCEEKF